MRCLALAQTLAEAGWTWAFAGRVDAADSLPPARNRGFATLSLQGLESDEPVGLEREWPPGCDLLVVDHYGLDARFERACRPWARHVLVVDDLADRSHDCDFLLDQTLRQPAGRYGSLVPERCHMLLGPEYALLRPEFAAARPVALARRRARPPVERILVSLGAADTSDVARTALQGVARSGIAAEVVVVLGPATQADRGIEDQARSMAQPVSLLGPVDDMARLMCEADLAIGAAGSSSYERCCLGLPAVVVVTASNQELLADGLQKERLALVAGSRHRVEAPDIAGALSRLANDMDLRTAMARAGMAACDGLGARRVAQRIAALVEPVTA